MRAPHPAGIAALRRGSAVYKEGKRKGKAGGLPQANAAPSAGD